MTTRGTVYPGSDYATPATLATNAVDPFQSADDIWFAFGPPENFWCTAMTAGCQFHPTDRRGVRWIIVPPCELQDEVDAKVVRWAVQAFDTDWMGRSSLGYWPFNPNLLLRHTLPLSFAARTLGAKAKRLWRQFNDGAIGGLLLPSGALRLAPGTIERLRSAKPLPSAQRAA